MKPAINPELTADAQGFCASSSQDDTPVLLRFAGVSIRLLSSSSPEMDVPTVFEYSAPHRFAGQELHYHGRATEFLHVLEGRLEVTTDSETRILRPHELMQIRPHTWHRFSNPFTERVRLLVLFSRGGMDGYFRELNAVVQSMMVWPLPDIQPLIALGERHDTYFRASEERGSNH